MRKIFLFLAVILCLGLCPVVAYASAPYETSGNDACSIAGFNDPLICGTGKTNEERELQNRVKNVLEVVYLWIGIIAVIVIVIGGIRYMTSQGEPDKIKGAKNTLTYALIGLIVTLMAFAITEFFIGALNGKAPEGTAVESTPESDSPAPGTEDVAHDEEVPVKSLQMVSKTTITEGESMQLKIKIIPDYATDHTIDFSSSDEKVAIINKQGRITAKKPGTTTITATAKNGIKTTTTVTVAELVKVKTIELRPENLTLTEGKSTTMSAVVLPKNAVDKTVTWDSSNKKVATVTNRGFVKAIKAGETTITVKSSNNVTATAKVTVKEKQKSDAGGGGSYNGGKGSLTAEQRRKIVEFSKTQIGVEYNWGPGGKCGGGAWDNDIPGRQLACNGLTRWAYHAAGVTIPKGSENQMRQGKVVTSTGKVSDMTAGDIIVWDPEGRRSDVPNLRIWSFGHVAIYIGNGQLIEATCPKAQQRAIGDNQYSYSITW